MAVATVRVTEGTGPLLDFRTVGAGADRYRQAIVVGDPTTDTAVAPVTLANGLLVDVSRVQGNVTVVGTGTLATQAAQSGTWTVQPGNTPNSTPWIFSQVPSATQGLTRYHLVSAATTNSFVVKASAGQLFGWYIYNSNAAARKVAFHNTAGTPTAGAAVLFSIVIPPTSAANVFTDIGITFSTGIAITTVTGLADADATAVASNDLVINLFYS